MRIKERLETKTVDVGNFFTEDGLDNLVSEMRKGHKVIAYVNCIGFTRANMVGAQYAEEMKNRFGDAVRIEKHDGRYMTTWTYEFTE